MTKRSLTIAGHVVDDRRRPVGKATITRKGKVVGESGDGGLFEVELAAPGDREALT